MTSGRACASRLLEGRSTTIPASLRGLSACALAVCLSRPFAAARFLAAALGCLAPPSLLGDLATHLPCALCISAASLPQDAVACVSVLMVQIGGSSRLPVLASPDCAVTRLCSRGALYSLNTVCMAWPCEPSWIGVMCFLFVSPSFARVPTEGLGAARLRFFASCSILLAPLAGGFPLPV